MFWSSLSSEIFRKQKKQTYKMTDLPVLMFNSILCKHNLKLSGDDDCRGAY